MNREIRFRGWDWNKMFQITEINFDYKEVFWERAENKKKENGCSCCDDRRDDWYDMNKIELMQRTWLKDKNWVYIYEGDVLSHVNWFFRKNIPWKNDLVYGEVKYYKCRYALYFLDNTQIPLENFPSGILTPWNWDIQVVWNKRENPELLSTP